MPENSSPEINNSNRQLEKEQAFRSYNVIIVSPGFPSTRHRSGLGLDTRLRILAATMFYEGGYTEKIITQGAQLKRLGMEEPLAELMKKELVKKRGVSENVIETETTDYDTATQIKWLKKNIDRIDPQGKGKNVAFLTDPEQGKQARVLLNNFGLREVDVLSSEDIILKLASKSKHFSDFLNRVHRSPYWLKWVLRERLLALLNMTIDPRGKLIGKVTQTRLGK